MNPRLVAKKDKGLYNTPPTGASGDGVNDDPAKVMRSADGQVSPSPVDILDVAALVLTASRLIGGLANLPLFKSAPISLTEWLALSILAAKEGLSNKMLARSLGVTGQRANQLCTSLSEAKLISITNAEDDSRRNVINITDTGKKQLGSLNSQLQKLVVEALGTRTQSLKRAGKHMHFMMRIVHAGTPETAAKQAKRAKRRELKAAGTGERPTSGK